jgi:hypothetical protein
LKEGTSTSSVDKTAVYRINLDFNVGSAVYTEITDMQLYFSPTDEFLFSGTYQGGGVWKASSQPLTFKQEGWGRDERYKFRMTTINAAGETVYEWWGTANKTDSRPNASSPASYYYMKQVTDDRWEDKWKFAGEMDMALVDLTWYFTAEEPYTHSVVKVGDQ